MGLLDDIRAQGDVIGQCSVRSLIDELPEEDAADLTRALDDPGIRHTHISRALVARGFDMHEKRIAAHRKGDCACPRG